MSDQNKNEEEIVFSKLTGKRRPPCKRTRKNEPNLELMAEAIIDLYYLHKKSELEKELEVKRKNDKSSE